MNNSDTILKGGIISDWLLDNHKSLQNRNDFEDLCDSLDDIQSEENAISFQEGFDAGFEQCLQSLLNSENVIDRDLVQYWHYNLKDKLKEFEND